ncbi:uncharacterized protein LOC113466806 [Diaphorina citri]|uniref:Uncharacterized protein LOC113466806 n=1 Tax=Diaphorina citri TaxID=121845 RepID=A0A3Q0IVB7_DIACI|nr:uncharacterized protein LOC113466806 [Diaphorina citri]
MDPHIALIFYKATVRATLDLGSIFYVNSAQTKLNKVHVIQSRAIRIAMGYLNSTPIDVMLQEAKEKTITDMLIDRFVLKSMSTQNQTSHKLNNFTIMHLTSKKLKDTKDRLSPPLVESYSNLSKYNTEIFTCVKPPLYTYDYEVPLTWILMEKLEYQDLALINWKKIGFKTRSKKNGQVPT